MCLLLRRELNVSISEHVISEILANDEFLDIAKFDHFVHNIFVKDLVMFRVIDDFTIGLRRRWHIKVSQ